MRISPSSPQHLTYCLNVHPGESWRDQLDAIRTHVLPLRDRVAPGRPFGLGLRLSHQAAQELNEASMAAFVELLKAHNLYVVTINAFPYGAFHGKRVKKTVYQPDWRTEARRDYTMRVADIASRLVAPGDTISISTVPGSYGAWITTDDDVSQMITHLVSVIAHLVTLERTRGIRIALGLEPEPDCFLQTTRDVISFFTGPLRHEGVPLLARRLGVADHLAEDFMARHLGVCFDTCHMALQFESLADSLAALTRTGILISKVQLSSALSTMHTPAAREALRAFLDPVYLHQVKVRSTTTPGLGSYPDLPDALDATSPDPNEEWRIHFHVPLYFETNGILGSTAPTLTHDFFKLLTINSLEHIEIETYTFTVLPPALQAIGIDESLRREYEWVQTRGCWISSAD